jgi:diguanylate cyclase (GGDEF)-like protein
MPSKNSPLSPDLLSAGQAYESLQAILDAIDALVYVADMETYEIYFINQYGRQIWGDGIGQQCWRLLQSDQTGPCSFCTNPKLVDAQGNPTGVLVWEFQNTVNGRWYQCRDQAITWINGRRARIEIATDISDLKNSVQALNEAKLLAETLSRTDELTGIRNRRALLDDARMLFNLARRYGTGLMLAVLDMDHFKRVNDTHGHASGDKVLIRMTETIQHNIREVDVFGRYGGEEFLLVLPGMDAEHGVQTLERLRKLVSELRFGSSQGEFGVSCSLGVALQHSDHTRVEDLVADADKALYRAKQNGRNRVELANAST